MKPQFLSRSTLQNCSFSLECHSYPTFLKVWHYHPELELVFILESTGSRFIGDSIEKFEPGEILLIGKNLPHLWLNDKEYFDKAPHLRAKAFVIHFMEGFTTNFLQIPEMESIREMFKMAGSGLKFEGITQEVILKKVNEMFELTGLSKLIKLLEILQDLSQQQYRALSSNGYLNTFQEINNSKISMVHAYIMNNFKKEVSLETAADLANMNSSAFSRYFKHIQKKTFTQFVNEVRIGYACKLLMEQKYKVAEVCYESGFRNLSNFNRQFKALKNTSPSEFIQAHTFIK